jgi:hypothetical protein
MLRRSIGDPDRLGAPTGTSSTRFSKRDDLAEAAGTDRPEQAPVISAADPAHHLFESTLAEV